LIFIKRNLIKIKKNFFKEIFIHFYKKKFDKNKRENNYPKMMNE